MELETYLVKRLTTTGPTHTITASAGAGGAISPAGAVVVNEGGDQAFAITPDLGHTISDVLVDGGSVGAAITLTVSNGASPLPITAVGNELDSTSGTIMHGGLDEGYNSTSLPNGFALGRMVRV